MPFEAVEVEARVRRAALPLRLSPASSLELGYSLFRPGPAGPALGIGDEGRVRHWGYVQLRAGF